MSREEQDANKEKNNYKSRHVRKLTQRNNNKKEEEQLKYQRQVAVITDATITAMLSKLQDQQPITKHKLKQGNRQIRYVLEMCKMKQAQSDNTKIETTMWPALPRISPNNGNNVGDWQDKAAKDKKGWQTAENKEAWEEQRQTTPTMRDIKCPPNKQSSIKLWQQRATTWTTNQIIN